MPLWPQKFRSSPCDRLVSTDAIPCNQSIYPFHDTYFHLLVYLEITLVAFQATMIFYPTNQRYFLNFYPLYFFWMYLLMTTARHNFTYFHIQFSFQILILRTLWSQKLRSSPCNRLVSTDTIPGNELIYTFQDK